MWASWSYYAVYFNNLGKLFRQSIKNFQENMVSKLSRINFQALVALENDKSRFLNKPSTIGPYVKTNSAYVKSLYKGFRWYVSRNLNFQFSIDIGHH